MRFLTRSLFARKPVARLPDGDMLPWISKTPEAFLRRLGHPRAEERNAAVAEFLRTGRRGVDWFGEVLAAGTPVERAVVRALLIPPAIASLATVTLLLLSARASPAYHILFPVLGAVVGLGALSLNTIRHHLRTGDLERLREGTLAAARELCKISDPTSADSLLRLLRRSFRNYGRVREVLDVSTLQLASTAAVESARIALARLLVTEAGARAIREKPRLVAELLRVVNRRYAGEEPRPDADGFDFAVVVAYRWVVDSRALGALQTLARRDGGPPHHTPHAVIETAKVSLAALEERLNSEEDARTLPRPSSQPEADVATLPVRVGWEPVA